MKHIKPFFGHCLQAPQAHSIGYIMGFQEYFELEEILSDLKSGITDLDDLFDEKKPKDKI